MLRREGTEKRKERNGKRNETKGRERERSNGIDGVVSDGGGGGGNDGHRVMIRALVEGDEDMDVMVGK